MPKTARYAATFIYMFVGTLAAAAVPGGIIAGALAAAAASFVVAVALSVRDISIKNGA